MRAATLATTGVTCPLCGWSGPAFGPMGRAGRHARCGGCNSLERHRAMFLYLRDETHVFERPTRLLHFAPEQALRPTFEKRATIDYVTTDLEMPNVSVRMDIGDLLFRDEVFDCVVCSHVLEHVTDDRAAMREIRRVLRPGGFALILVPVLETPGGGTFEDPSISTPEARERAYGQRDHARAYGRDFPERARECGFDVEAVSYGRLLGPDAAARFGLLDDEQLFVCRPHQAAAASTAPAASHRRAKVGFSTELSADDGMAHRGRLHHYFGVGLGALRIIEDALKAAASPPPVAILDLPSGHGRVLRMLRHRFPEATITACDTDPKGVEFCAREFGAEALVAPGRPDDLLLPRAYDLIWCGSLLTHLPERDCETLLARFARQLKPGGLLVFTTHGTTIEELIAAGRMSIPVDAPLVASMLRRFREAGFGFAPYDHSRDGSYGIALASPEWTNEHVREHSGLRLLSHSEAAWDGRQDATVCQRAHA